MITPTLEERVARLETVVLELTVQSITEARKAEVAVFGTCVKCGKHSKPVNRAGWCFDCFSAGR